VENETFCVKGMVGDGVCGETFTSGFVGWSA